MQIGSRWRLGEAPLAKVPAPIVAAIAAEERELAELGAETSGWYWTLTWLEGSAVVELDDGTRITLDGDSAVVSREP